MWEVWETPRPEPINFGALRRIMGKFYTCLLAAGAAIAPMINAAYHELFSYPRLLVALVVLLLLYILRCPRLLFAREFALYAGFVGYLFLSLLWAPDVALAMNTLFPAVNFLLILVLFGSLVAFHDLRAVLIGLLGGFSMGAVFYTYTQGFPFTYPQDFSYNAIAGMYLFGLFTTLIFGWATRFRIVTLSLALIILIHIAATTSIKTNLGILLGLAAAGVFYFNQSIQILRRHTVLIVVVTGLLACAVLSSDAIVERVQAGIDRVFLGLDVLRARDDLAGYGGYGDRRYWEEQGLQGWLGNPLFGNGVESFRAGYGITSHSTPVDLLYNTGLIGFSLFYSIFASIAWRLFEAQGSGARTLRALIFATLICQLFMTLSGTLFYQTFLAIFVGLSAALLRRFADQAPQPLTLSTDSGS